MKKNLITFLVLLISLFSLISCQNFGKEKNFKGVQLFYTSEIRESQADSLGNFLIESGFADGQTKTVQITKTENTYEYRMVVKKGIEQDQEYCDFAKEFGALLSVNLFNQSPVDIHFCDENLNTLKVIPMGDITEYMQSELESMNATGSDDYSIKYSSDWTLDNSGVSGIEFVILSPLDSENDKFQENITLIIQDLTGENLDLDSYSKLSEDQIKTMITNVTIKENSRITKANYDCQKIVYTSNNGETKLYFEQYYWVINNKAYVLTYTAEQSKYNIFKNLVDTMLHSFELTIN